ncbi:MAG: 30S ribosomal protein S12 methylthiotransferase RimO [Bdellovibrionales bacterium]
MKELRPDTKRVHFVSLGCPKNLVDTEIMLGFLMRDGYQVVDQPEQADTVVVNTCGFIEASKQESLDKILEMAELKGNSAVQKVVVAGCLTQRYQEDLVKGLPEADLFVGSGQFQNIAEILKKSKAGHQEKRFFNLPTYLQEDQTPRVNSGPRHRAYLKISEGCKKRCAFCAIPLIRGNLQSRSLKSIVSEAKLLVAGGVKELIVVSHDFTDFGWDLRKHNEQAQETPAALLKALAEQSGARWIRVMYNYPDGISPETLSLMKEHESLIPYFDMPLQHINNQVLKSMNRRMTREKIESTIGNIRDLFPEAILRTQFIVGFPGETEEQFEELVEFVKHSQFDRVGCFVYSPEEGTKAAALSGQVNQKIKARRHDELMSVQQEISRAKQKDWIGRTVEVLVDGVSEETELLLAGRHAGQAPEIDGVTYINDGQASPGDLVKVEITDAMDYDLVGRIL